MSDELDALKLLSAQDKQIQEIHRKLRAIPKQLAEARKQLDSEQKVLDEVKIPHDAHALAIQEKETTITIALETIQKFEEHMKQVTTQAEYLAARKQIDEAKRLNLRLEDEIGELKEKQQGLVPAVKERQQIYDNVRDTYASAEAQVLEQQTAWETQLAELERTKAKTRQTVETHTLAYYERLTRGGRIPALVSTTAGICSGCNIALPPQVYNQLIANPTRYNSCSHCNRMIYYEPPATEEEGETISA